MKSIFGALFIYLTGLHSSTAQKFKLGDCPNVTPVNYFNVNNYYGRWYQYAGYSGIFEEGKCIVWDFYGSQNPIDSDSYSTFSLKRSSVNDNEVNKLQTKLSAKCAASGTTGQFYIQFDEVIPGVSTATILEANERFILLFGCKENLAGHFEGLWLFTRTPHLRKTDFTTIKFVLKQNKLRAKSLIFNIQEPSCIYE